PRRTRLYRLRLLSSPCPPARRLLRPPAAGRPRPLPPADGSLRPLVRPPRLCPGRLQLLHARHRRIARTIRPAVRPGGRLWLSHGPLAGPVRFAARLPAAGPGGAVADPRHGPGSPHAPRPAARRRVAGRPCLLLLCPPGVVRPRRPPRLVPGAPAAADL